jgi:hypothetical protein
VGSNARLTETLDFRKQGLLHDMSCLRILGTPAVSVGDHSCTVGTSVA